MPSGDSTSLRCVPAPPIVSCVPATAGTCIQRAPPPALVRGCTSPLENIPYSGSDRNKNEPNCSRKLISGPTGNKNTSPCSPKACFNVSRKQKLPQLFPRTYFPKVKNQQSKQKDEHRAPKTGLCGNFCKKL